MNRRNYITALLCNLFSLLCAQNEHLKNDYRWPLGYNYWGNLVKYEGPVLDFHQSPAAVLTESRWAEFDNANTSLCNDEGQLVAYTNGCRMFNGQHEVMIRGDSLPDDWIRDDYCPLREFYVLRHANLLLPRPGSDSMVHHISFGFRPNNDTILFYLCDTIYENVINLKAGGGRGIVGRRQPVLTDTFFGNHLTACRHGNGRDWWVVVRTWLSDRYHFLLLDTSGLHYHHTQRFGVPSDRKGGGTGQAVFSPDGAWFIASENRFGLRLYRFDRCSGLFYGPPLELPVMEEPNDSGWNTPGVAVSSNNRFLYVAFFFNCYQFDLTQSDILATQKNVARWDSSRNENGWATTMYYLKLGPDGKIYGSIPGPNTYLHRINYPDLEGEACDFEQRAIRLPNWNYSMLPNIAWPRTGVLTGSPCDTLGLVSAVKSAPRKWEVQIWPNPASSELWLSVPEAAGTSLVAEMTDLGGRPVLCRPAPSGRQTVLDVSGLSPGFYVLRCRDGSGCVVSVHKVVVQR